MSFLSRLKASPSLVLRALVTLGAVAAIVGAVATSLSQPAPPGADALEELLALVAVGALTRRYGIPLPGHGFSSYILGVVTYATLDRGWPFAVVVAPVATLAGDLALRRLRLAAALDTAAHMTAGTAIAGLAYAGLDGATGADAVSAANLGPLAVFAVLLPSIVNATFYLELRLGRGVAWVDSRLTARWEAVVCTCSAGLALAALPLAHASLETP